MEYLVLAVVVLLCILGILYCIRLIRDRGPRKGWGPGPSIDDVMEQGRQDLKSALKSRKK